MSALVQRILRLISEAACTEHIEPADSWRTLYEEE